MEFVYLINEKLYTFFPIYNTDIVKIKGCKGLERISFYDYVALVTHPKSTFIGEL